MQSFVRICCYGPTRNSWAQALYWALSAYYRKVSVSDSHFLSTVLSLQSGSGLHETRVSSQLDVHSSKEDTNVRGDDLLDDSELDQCQFHDGVKSCQRVISKPHFTVELTSLLFYLFFVVADIFRTWELGYVERLQTLK